MKTSRSAKIIFGGGIVICLWVAAALTSALYQVNWSITELAKQYMVATGLIKPLHTLVDYYSHIKGIEYLICVAFFIAFPVFFKYVNKDKTKIRKTIQAPK